MITTQRNHGFTLLELMFVVAIIGVLASVGLPAYQPYTVRSKIAESLVLVTAVEKSIGDYYAYTGKLPTNNQAAGLPEPRQLRGRYVSSITVADGAIHLNVDRAIPHNRDAPTDVHTISLRPAVLPVYPPNATLVWYCGLSAVDKNLTVFGQNQTTVASKYLPNACR